MNILTRGGWMQRLRLTAGLILFAFVLTHLLNHAAGIFGIAAMEAIQAVRTAITRSVLGSGILVTAALVHVSLGLFKTARRSTLHMPAWEILQILSGLSIPFLIAPHLTYGRVAHELFGVKTTYLYELYLMWPAVAWMQALMLLVVWTHAMIGLHFWLRLSKSYARAFPLALAAAVAVPLAALAGFVTGGREAASRIFDAESFSDLAQKVQWPSDAAFGRLSVVADTAQLASLAIVATLLAVLGTRYVRHRLGPRIEVRYIGGPVVQAPVGATLLETSRRFGVPHASVCGGRARCSTCRVLVEEGHEQLAAPGPTEQETLTNIKAPKNVRLACQIRPNAPIAVSRLLSAGNRARLPGGQAPQSREDQGVERALAVMFLDVRDFTRISEARLPYDVVYLLNELFNAAGGAIVANGGWIDKYLGDGLMAIFGRESGTRQGCQEALAAARAIDHALEIINNRFADELGAPLKIGIGIHVGPVVLGRIGHAGSAGLTVIGKTVNAAARLEALTKEFSCQLVASDALVHRTSLIDDGFERHTTPIRGLSEELDVICIPEGRLLRFEGEGVVPTIDSEVAAKNDSESDAAGG